LDEQPGRDGVSDRNFVNVASLQFGEEIVDLHFGATTFWTSASKRGSPRSGSKMGSTLM